MHHPQVEPLNKNHDVNGFDCGTPKLNEWLQTIAGQHQAKSLSKTYLLVADSAEIVGFLTLAVRGMTPKETMPPGMVKKLPKEIPGFTLARLAVSERFKGQGYGEFLLFDAIARAQDVAEQTGGPFLFVDAKDAEAAAFYMKYGFAPFPSDPLTLVLRL
jgi:GNAT superfamily N-acetyltransferase